MGQLISEFIKSKNAILIEDDLAIAQLLKINLEQLGFNVDVFHDAETAQSILLNQNYSLCLLDWMLPQMQGIDFLKKIREQVRTTKIMMITAKADADSIVEGLESGADDYLTKPFDSKVLAARIRNLMRRQIAVPIENKSDELGFDGLSINLSQHIVKLNSQEIHLTPSEFKLLSELIKAKGKVLTRDQLIDLIQGQDVSVTGRTIDTHVFTLRKKIISWSKHIETIRGIGYRVLVSVDDVSEPETSP